MIEYYLFTDEGYSILCACITVLIFIPSLIIAMYHHWNRRDRDRNDYLFTCFVSPAIAIFLLPVITMVVMAILLIGIPYYLFTKLPQKEKDYE